MSDALAEVLGAMTEREASWWRSWFAADAESCARRSRGEGGGRVSASGRKRLCARRFGESSANRSRPLAASHIRD